MTAATEVLVELLLEGFAHQVQCKRVKARIGEGQDTSEDTAHKMSHGGVHLLEGKGTGNFEGYENALFFKRVNFMYLRVMIGAIQVDDMTGEPAYCKETDEHKDGLGQAFS